ncbi:MAG: hypothetical protein J7L96_11265, partial [Bacteroidales bacterium]|nr:hypothetical protein [Bacteroidales bacterium]
WDVDFKLNAPKNTTLEASLKNGKITQLKVTSLEREKDVIINLSDIEIDKRNELLEDLLQWQLNIKAPIPGKANPEYLIREDQN